MSEEVVLGKVQPEWKSDIEERLSGGESLRSIAASYNVRFQSLQYWRKKWGCAPLAPCRVKGADHPHWRGGYHLDKKAGYMMVYSPDRGKVYPYAYVHTVVAEKMIGRQLHKGEHVHHIDGDKLNNDEGNLLVLTDSEHKALHGQLQETAYALFRSGRIAFANGRYYVVE